MPQDLSLRAAYDQGWKATDIFPVSSVGLVTSRDAFVFDFDLEALRQRMEQFHDDELTDDELRQRFQLGKFDVAKARKQFRAREDWTTCLTRCLYRPFDIRHLCYADELLERSRWDTLRHMLSGKNLGLISARSNKSSEMNHFFCTRNIVETKSGEATTQSCLFPLYVSDTENTKKAEWGKAVTMALFDAPAGYHALRPNLSLTFLKALADKLKLPQGGSHGLPKGITPEDIFHYAYAVFHSPTYRTRYAEFLKIDFPRLPLTSDFKLFRALAAKGAELTPLHLMESPKLDGFITEFPAKGSNEVEKAQYTGKNKRVWINAEQYFSGVPKNIWEFQIGGYQVCEKWLKDRKGRKLSYDDIQHYQKIVVALSGTIRLMGEIDAMIPAWPLA